MRSYPWTTYPWTAALRLAGVWVAFSAWAAQGGVILQFDCSFDSSGFFASGSTARASLQAAGDFFEGLLLDDLTAIAPGAGRSWTALFIDPATGQQRSLADLYVPADTLIVYVGARDLGASTLGQAGPGGYNARGPSDWGSTVRARGEGNTVGGDADDFGPWGGSLAVDVNASWNTNSLVSPTYGQNDLYSVLLHELGHVLGFGTSPSWTNLVDGSQFTGAASEGQYGNAPVPLSGSSHWANSIASRAFPNGTLQEAAMDPDLLQGTRKQYTRLDAAGLDDVGWDIAYPAYLDLEPGDLDGDGWVGGSDLDIVRSHWGQRVGPGNLLEGDLSGDGWVGEADLDMVRSHWGEGARAPGTAPEPSLPIALAGMGVFVMGRCLRPYLKTRWNRSESGSTPSSRRGS